MLYEFIVFGTGSHLNKRLTANAIGKIACSGYVGDKVRPGFAIKPGASGDITLKPGETNNESVLFAGDEAMKAQ